MHDAPGRWTVLALLAALCACSEPAPQPVSESQSAPRLERVRRAAPGGQAVAFAAPRPTEPGQPLERDLGGWTPDAELLLRATEYAQTIPTDTEAYLEDDEVTAELVTLLRAGLRLADTDAARRCARLARAEWLDAWESARAAELLVDTVWVHPDQGGYSGSEFMRLARTEDAWSALLRMPPSGSGDPEQVEWIAERLSDLVQRGSEIPRIVQAARRDDHRFARRALRWALSGTDAGRPEAARVLVPAADALPPGPARNPGLPPVLRAALEHLVGDARRSDPVNRPLGGWTLRWLWHAEPSAVDAELLIRVGDLQFLGATEAAARALRHLRDDPTRAWLEAHRNHGGALGPLVRSSLAARGDRAAPTALIDAARSEPHALALLLADHPQVAAEQLRDEWFAQARPSDHPVLTDLNAVLIARTRLGLTWPAETFAGAEEAALASDLDCVTLARIGAHLPALCTRRIAELAVGRTTERDVAILFDPDDVEHAPERLRAFLALGAHEALRARLRTLATGTSDNTRRCALFGLACLGDPRDGDLLLACIEDDPDELELFGPSGTGGLTALACCPSPEVLESLRRAASEDRPPADGEDDADELERVSDAVCALAIARGLPPETAERLEAFEHAPAAFAEVRAHVVGGALDDALLAVTRSLRSNPEELPLLGVRAGPNTRRHLAELRDARELGLRTWALAQLAVAGDADARAEWIAELRAGRPWYEDDGISAYELTLGYEPDLIRFWIGELDSQRVLSTGEIGHLFDQELFVWRAAESYAWTPQRVALERWKEHGGRYAKTGFSRLLMPVPR